MERMTGIQAGYKEDRMREDIERYWRELRLTMKAMPYAALSRVAEALLECRERDGTVFVAGNGGSAATASHFACDLAKGAQAPGVAPFRVVPLTDNVPLLTAWANDVSYEQVFAQQLAPLIRPGDLLVAISASGSSPNILAAARLARKRGAEVIAFTGASGGKLYRLASLTVRVPSPTIEQVEDAHLMIAHSLCVTLRERLRLEAAGAALAQEPIIGVMALDREGDARLAL
jgi:D-sedoheptulose 7-phosphate isomerase